MSKWEMVRLEECITLTSGKFLSKKQRVDGEYNVYGGNGINGKHNEYFINEPTVVIGRVGEYCGCVHTTGEKVWVTDNALYVTQFLKAIHTDYICYALNKKNLNRYANKSGQPSISQSTILKIQISLPPIKVQKKIAKTLDTASELITLRKKQLAELDNLIKATFYDMFGDPVLNEKGWKIKTVNDVCEKILGGGTPSKQKPEYYIGNIPWVTPKDMKSILINDSIDHINEDAIANSSAKLIPARSILMVIRSGILKRMLPVAINSVDVAVNQDMKAFITNENVSTEYLLYFFIMIQKDILKNVRAVTADNIEFSLIKNTIVPIPPLFLQEKFAEIVTKIEEQKDLVQKAIDESQYLSNSLMSEYFE